MTRFSVRQDLSSITSFFTFPFEDPLTVRQLIAEAPELARPGEEADDCEFCVAPDDDFIWTDDDWRLRLHRPSPLPGTVVLNTRAHWDSLQDLPVEMISAFGPLCARIEGAVLGLGNVGRVHLYRSGDGHAHFHVWFFARPMGFQQFRGVFLLTWAQLLDPRPEDEITKAGRAVAKAMKR